MAYFCLCLTDLSSLCADDEWVRNELPLRKFVTSIRDHYIRNKIEGSFTITLTKGSISSSVCCDIKETEFSERVMEVSNPFSTLDMEQLSHSTVKRIKVFESAFDKTIDEISGTFAKLLLRAQIGEWENCRFTERFNWT